MIRAIATICLSVFIAACTMGCEKESESAKKPATAPTTHDPLDALLEPTTLPTPVASPEAIAKFIKSAQPLHAQLNDFETQLVKAMTLGDYKTRVEALNKALAGVEAPPAESGSCQMLMVYMRDAVRNFRQGETYMLASIPDPQIQQRLKGKELAEYVAKLRRQDDYCKNAWSAAVKCNERARKEMAVLTQPLETK